MTEDSNFWSEQAMAPELSRAEKALRDKFVTEYMHDFDQTGAAIRCGFLPSFAQDYATRFMDEAYVRRAIADRQKAIAEDPRAEAEETKRRIRANLLREAHYTGPGASHAARVSANAKLASVYGMDAPIKTQNEHLHRGGVMCVPAIASIPDWEAAATASQEQLRQASEVEPRAEQQG